MSSKHKQWSQMFSSIKLKQLYEQGYMDELFERHGNLMNPETLVASGGDTTVFLVSRDDAQYVIKIAPKSIRFFKHFGKNRSAAEIKKYINRLDPYFLPVEEDIYENDYLFAYTQKKCHIIKSKKINKNVVAEIFRLIQFMLVNNILLTDLAPHNLGVIHKKVFIFDYHGLHRLMKDGVIKRDDWWRRLARNLTRFICGLYNPHKRPEYSALMQSCDQQVIKKMSSDPDIPKVFTQLINYLLTEQSGASVKVICTLLEGCISHINGKKN